MTPAEVAGLAAKLADSGRRLQWGSGAPVVDLASTGGPGSLSTLLAPLELRRLGCRVVKLGVPGRPAGGIDVLGTVPGYATRLDEAAVRRAVGRCGYAHFLADEQFAPMDAALFAYRLERGAAAVPALAAASLLAKKIAAGVHVVGLDVRVGGHGNFGATVEEARNNARLFCAAARLVGIDAVAFLFECSGPEQPWVGRGEALIAVDHVVGGLSTEVPIEDLETHALRCFTMAREIARIAGVAELAELAPTGGVTERQSALSENLDAQGASLAAFRHRARTVARAPRQPIRARTDGQTMLDLAALRDAIVGAQRQVQSRIAQDGHFADPTGVIVHLPQGRSASAGDVVASVRGAGPDAVEWHRAIGAAFTVIPGSAPADPASYRARMEVVHA